MILWQLAPSKYFPHLWSISYNHCYVGGPHIPFLPKLLPGAPTSQLPARQYLTDSPLRRQRASVCLTMQDIFSLDRGGSKLQLGVPCLTCLSFEPDVSHLSFFTYPKCKRISADRKEDETAGLVKLPRANNREVFIKQLQLVVSWI